MESFIPKIVLPAVGLHIIYADSLYYNSSIKAQKLKQKYEPLAHAHKYAFVRLLEKHPKYVRPSFMFSSWSQLLLEAKEFFGLFGELKKIYQNDPLFQKFVAEDSGRWGKITDNKANFILEETLLFYLVSKGRVRLRNDFIHDAQKWVLWCYPGKPLFSEIYLYKKNFFNFHNPENVYENSFYDL